MERTLEERIELSKNVSEKIISDMELKLQQAINREDWKKAADLDSYISGMKQIHILIEQLAS